MVLVMVLALVLSIGILRGHGHVHGPVYRNLTVMEPLTSYTAEIQRIAWWLALVKCCSEQQLDKSLVCSRTTRSCKLITS